MRVQLLSEKQVLQTEKSCSLRSVGLCGSEAGRPGKSQCASVTQMIFFMVKGLQQSIFLKH